MENSKSEVGKTTEEGRRGCAVFYWGVCPSLINRGALSAICNNNKTEVLNVHSWEIRIYKLIYKCTNFCIQIYRKNKNIDDLASQQNFSEAM